MLTLVQKMMNQIKKDVDPRWSPGMYQFSRSARLLQSTPRLSGMPNAAVMNSDQDADDGQEENDLCQSDLRELGWWCGAVRSSRRAQGVSKARVRGVGMPALPRMVHSTRHRIGRPSSARIRPLDQAVMRELTRNPAQGRRRGTSPSRPAQSFLTRALRASPRRGAP